MEWFELGDMKYWVDVAVWWKFQLVGDFTNAFKDFVRSKELVSQFGKWPVRDGRLSIRLQA